MGVQNKQSSVGDGDNQLTLDTFVTRRTLEMHYSFH